LPLRFFFALTGMVVTYLILVETAKRYFFRRWPSLTGQGRQTRSLAAPAK